MKKLKFIFALAAAFIFSGCYETTLLTRMPISALVSDKSSDVKSTLVLAGITPADARDENGNGQRASFRPGR